MPDASLGEKNSGWSSACGLSSSQTLSSLRHSGSRPSCRCAPCTTDKNGALPGATPAAGARAPLVNLGGGFGIPYFSGDTPVDIALVGERLADVLEPDQAYAIELGRWIAGECGVYLTRIVDRKVSHGEVYLVTDGGLHHQLAASGNFGTVVRRNYPSAIATRYGAEPTEEVNIVGCLCTPLDRLADNAAMPRADVGDLVAVFCAGAYGASASPAAFLGHGPAAELLV